MKSEVMINSKTLGGAKMIDFQNTIWSMQALWIKRFLSSTSKSTDLALNCAGIKDKNILLLKLPAANFQSLSKFDSQTIESWYKFYAVCPNIIQEILNEKLVYYGNFKSIEETEIEFDCDLEYLRYSVLSVIPMALKTKIKSSTTLEFTTSNWEILKLNVEKLSNKDIYNSLTYNMLNSASQNKGVEYYPFVDKCNWSEIYLLPAKVISNLKL